MWFSCKWGSTPIKHVPRSGPKTGIEMCCMYMIAQGCLCRPLELSLLDIEINGEDVVCLKVSAPCMEEKGLLRDKTSSSTTKMAWLRYCIWCTSRMNCLPHVNVLYPFNVGICCNGAYCCATIVVPQLWPWNVHAAGFSWRKIEVGTILSWFLSFLGIVNAFVAVPNVLKELGRGGLFDHSVSTRHFLYYNIFL